MAIAKESVAALILSTDHKSLLLTKRRDIPVWVMPGGGIDDGESPEEATLREIKEETGAKAEIVKLIAIYLPTNKMTKKTYFFECRLLEEQLSITEETRAAEFFSLDKLPYHLPPPYPEWLQDFLSDTPKPLCKTMKSVTYLNLLKNFILHPTLVIRFILSRLGIHLNQE